jgi:hypothetical protein
VWQPNWKRITFRYKGLDGVHKIPIEKTCSGEGRLLADNKSQLSSKTKDWQPLAIFTTRPSNGLSAEVHS